MRIADLIHGLNVQLVGAPELANLRVCDITEDSRTVLPGSLFIARTGEKVDGKQFIPGAVAAGAVAILTDDPSFDLGTPALRAGNETHAPGSESRATQPPHPVALLTTPDINLATAQLAERFYGDPSSKLTVIGVTGTNGKTTTTFLIHQILNTLGIRSGLIGTVVIDDGVEVAPASLTTPPALEVSRTMARMLEAGCRAAVMEVSSHSLHQHRVGAIRFNAGVFTNLTGDHLDYHGTMENYAAAKAMLFTALPHDGVAVVNIQDVAHSDMVKGIKLGVRVVRCAVLEPGALPVTGGTAPETVRRAKVVGADTGGTSVEFTGPWGHRITRIPLVGAFNVMNALEAVATVHALFGGTDEDALSFEIIAGALEKASAPPGRLEPVARDGDPIQVFVDYAHTDDALATVLRVLGGAMGRARAQAKHVPPGRGVSEVGHGPTPPGRAPGSKSAGDLWCVFGCGGDRDRTKRPRMGRVAADLADRVVITSDNPRTEDPAAIIAEIRAGVPASGQDLLIVEPDREQAIQLAIRSAAPGDTIIIAGKGHEDYQILPDPKKKGATITRHFDDREIARAALKARGLTPREAPQPPKPEDDPDLTAGASLALGG